MDKELRVQLEPGKLAEVETENLFLLLEDLQNATANLFQEAWRRGVQQELAAKGMRMKHEGPDAQ